MFEEQIDFLKAFSEDLEPIATGMHEKYLIRYLQRVIDLLEKSKLDALNESIRISDERKRLESDLNGNNFTLQTIENGLNRYFDRMVYGCYKHPDCDNTPSTNPNLSVKIEKFSDGEERFVRINVSKVFKYAE